MGDGAGFASYVVARWPALVRTLVLLGSTPDQAETDVRSGLARGRSQFEQVRREGDLDVWAYRLALEARARQEPPASFDSPGVVDPTIADSEDRRARLELLLDTLSTLAPEEREVVVLHHLAGLDRAQVADVLGVGADVVGARLSEPAPPEVFLETSEVIPVRAAPVAAIDALARARRRRVVRWTAVAVAGLLGLVAAVTWATTRPEVEPLPEAVITKAVNPANLAWYADRTLHLSDVTVELSQVAEMVDVPGGVVYADRSGRIVLVDAEGGLDQLGRTEPGTPIAGSGDRGWVAWLDADGSSAWLVVWDTRAGRELARLPVDPGALPIAIDQDKVYYSEGKRAFAWTAGQPEPSPEARDELLDVSSAVRVTRFGDSSILISQPLFGVEVSVPGVGAVVSADGDYVLTRVSFARPDEVRVYESATGNPVELDLNPEDVALAAGFGPDDTVSFVLARREHAPGNDQFMRLSNSGPLTLRTCDLDSGACRPITQFAHNRGIPVLPH